MDPIREYPLAPSQQLFWALHQVFPDSSIGNLCLQLHLRGPLQREALLASLQRLAQGFELWRTTIHFDPAHAGGEPVAVVHDIDPYPVEEVDLSCEAPQQRGALLASMLRERVECRFDLARGPLMRVMLVRLDAEDHLLQFVSHHVAVDGASLYSVLGRELGACYSEFVRGDASSHRTPMSYAHFAAAQREIVSAEQRPALRFWSETLAELSGALALPSDHVRTKQRGWRGSREKLVIAPSVRQQLQVLALQCDSSLPDLLLAAFAIQLQRYSDQDDFLIGVANQNRRDPTYRELFGCLVLTAPVRCGLHGDPTVRELLQTVRATKRAAFAHLDPGVDALLSEMSAAAGRQGSAYQAVFNYMPFSIEGANFERLTVQSERIDPGWTAVELSLDVRDLPEQCECVLDYATDLFTAETGRRYLSHYATLLESIANASQSTRISELTMLPDAERRELLSVAVNASPPTEHTPRCLHEFVHDSVVRNGAALAVVSGERSLSYAELWTRATTLSQPLRARGALVGERVAILLADPVDTLVAMLATLQAGAAYVPIDPALPKDRILYMLSKSRPAVLVAQQHTCLMLGPLPCAALDPDSESSRRSDAGPGELTATKPVTPEDPAYVIFTSGSSGRPKGVVVRHRNVVNQLFARIAGYPAAPARFLVPHSMVWDAAAGGVYWTLATGGMLVLPDAEERRDPIALRRLIGRHAVTHLDIVPSLYSELLASEPCDELQSLDTVIVGGEACSAALARRHFAVLPRAALYNEYGPTETTVYSTVHRVSSEHISDPVPIGRPIANTRCYVLDRQLQLAPWGVPGELYIGGLGVALGYFDDPERTAERFVLDPFADGPGARMYRSGDLVRRRAHGPIEFLGRIDRQIKIRGYRIELGEIEAALQRCEGVADAVAVPREDAGGTRIDAYLTVTPHHAALEVDRVRAALRAELPAYMVPTHLAVVERFPVTPAGKIDIKKLALPPADAGAKANGTGQRYVEPRTQTELELAQIWSGLLGRPRIGARDDFFELGGHSLLAVRMLSLVESRLGARVSLGAFFQSSELRGLASLLHRDAALAEESLVVTIKDGDHHPPFWLLHPVGGHVVFARRLALEFDPKQPLIGIQAQGLDGRREPLRTIESMAVLYEGLIRARQPQGPYYLGGHSFGGLIALEIAQRLHAAGDEVGMLALLDTPGPDYPRRASFPRRVWEHARARARPLLGYAMGASAAAQGLGKPVAYDPLRDERSRGALVDAIERVTHCNGLAAKLYRPRYYPGTLHMLRARQTPNWIGMRFDDEACGWAPYAHEVIADPIECTHQDMMDEPAVHEVGRKLQARLRACQARRFGRGVRGGQA